MVFGHAFGHIFDSIGVRDGGPSEFLDDYSHLYEPVILRMVGSHAKKKVSVRLVSAALVVEHHACYGFVMKLRLLVEYDLGTKRWSAVFPELPGCGSAGDTEDEAVVNAKEALSLWFEPVPLKLKKRARMLEVAVP